MNARRKAKKYKRELDELKGKVVRPKVFIEKIPIKQHRASLIVPQKAMDKDSEYFNAYVREILARKLLEAIKDNLIIHEEELDDYYESSIRFTTDIWLAVEGGES